MGEEKEEVKADLKAEVKADVPEDGLKTSDEILNELFSSIGAPNVEDGEASEDSEASSPSESAEKSHQKKSKKAKKEKKKKKKKDKKKRHSSPQRKAKPLSPPRPNKSLEEWEQRRPHHQEQHHRRDEFREDYRRDHRGDDRRERPEDRWDRLDDRRERFDDRRERHEDRRDRLEDHRDIHRDRRDDHWDRHDDRRDRPGDHTNRHDDRRNRPGDHSSGRRDRIDERRDRPDDRRDPYSDRRDRPHDRHNDRRDRPDDRRDRPDDRRDRPNDRRDRPDDRRDHHPRDERRSHEQQRPPKRSSSNQDDPFWDNRWEAMELQKKADALEKRGRHFLSKNDPKDAKAGTSSSGNKRKSKSPSPETDELKQLKKMKQIQDLVVKESEKYVAEPLDPNLFEWDNTVKMWKRKEENGPNKQKSYEEELKERMEEQFREAKSYEEELKERMEEQFREGKRKDNPSDDKKELDKDKPNEEGDELESKESDEKPKKDETKPPAKKQKIDETKMSLDEIEEIRKKREKFKEKQEKEKKEKEEKEEGEVQSDDEQKEKKRNYRKHSPSVSSRHRSRSRDRSSRHRSRSKDRDVRSFRHRSRSKERNQRPSRHRSRSIERNSRSSRHRSRSRDNYKRPRSRTRYRSRSPAGRYFTSFKSSRDGRGYRDRDRDRYTSRRRSRSKEKNSFRGSRSEIDKAKLLAIAKRNAVKLLSSDNLMGMDHDKLIAIKSGGQSLRQLTDFCRELASRGITDEFDDDDDILYGAGRDDNSPIHHPFEVKDRPVPNPYSSLGVVGERLTPAMKTAAMSHRMLEYPVSSGNAHRVKEADVKEDSEETEIKAIEDKSEPIEEPAEPQPTEAEKLNAANPLGVIMFGGVPEPPKELTYEEPAKETDKAESEAKTDTVFEPIQEPNKDISSIVSERLGAMKKLTQNPNDPEALRQLYDAQKEMSKWAESKNKPGQFTGHTGAKILSQAELSTGIQAWARQEQFTKAQKVSGGFGEFMLKKMGWSEGEGLGKTRSGDVDPLTLDIKMDKKGLMAAEEDSRKRGNKSQAEIMTLTACKDLSHKHPVSGLMELATKRKWGPPNFVQIFECGPSHKKQYIFKVTVNGQDFQPTIASDNKKKAKADAATAALIGMGLLPKDPNNPL